MKKLLWLLTLYIVPATIFAQEPSDALRMAWSSTSGTARTQAIGGAIGALGGDITSAYVNPAGLAFYKTGDAVLSFGYKSLSTSGTYLGRTEQDRRGSLVFGTNGFVVGTNTKNSKGKNGTAAFALAINRTAEFGSNILYRGLNNKNSYSYKFLEEINGERDANNVAQNYPFGTSLAFNTYWIDTIGGGSSGNYQFQSRATVGSGLLQENVIANKGGITELAIAFAGSSQDKYYYGLTLGFPFMNYERQSTFTEADATTNTANKFDYASISEYLSTKGSGINLKLGFTYKPAPFVRLGLAIHTPTFYKLTDHYNASVTTNTESYKGEQTQSSYLFTNNKDAAFSYYHKTPFRFIASAAYVLHETEDVKQQKGFLTADIEYINYKGSTYTRDPQSDNSQSTRAYLSSLNNAIDNAYQGAINVRVGGELKFTTFMVRGGVAHLGNPYINIAGETGSKMQYTGGIGYRNKGFFIDITYIQTTGNDVHFAYRLEKQSYSGATLKQNGGTILFTIGSKF